MFGWCVSPPSPNLPPNLLGSVGCIAIGFPEWNQRNSHTEHRTFWPNLWGGGGWCLVVNLRLVCAGAYGNSVCVGRHFWQHGDGQLQFEGCPPEQVHKLCPLTNAGWASYKPRETYCSQRSSGFARSKAGSCHCRSNGRSVVQFR